MSVWQVDAAYHPVVPPFNPMQLLMVDGGVKLHERRQLDGKARPSRSRLASPHPYARTVTWNSFPEGVAAVPSQVTLRSSGCGGKA